MRRAGRRAALGCVLPLAVLLAAPAAPGEGAAGGEREADARQALAAAVAQADAGALEVASAAFAQLAEHGDAAIALPASFNLARTRFERAVRRTLPAAPAKREKSATIADVRALLARMRDELESARAELLRVIVAAPDDGEALASCHAVVERLRTVLARDAEWAAAAEAALRRGGANGPLKPGPAAARAAAGAPGEKGGKADGAGDGPPSPPSAAVPAPADGPSATELEDVRKRLDQSHEDRAEQERRRAAAQRGREALPRQ